MTKNKTLMIGLAVFIIFFIILKSQKFTFDTELISTEAKHLPPDSGGPGPGTPTTTIIQENLPTFQQLQQQGQIGNNARIGFLNFENFDVKTLLAIIGLTVIITFTVHLVNKGLR